MLNPYICHIHFRDGYRDESQPEGATYTLPGQGDYPLEALFTLLKKDRYANWFSLEWEWLWHPELPSLEEALVTGRQRGLW
jgi:sugar phosphate isomerase/epimerase